MIYEFSPSPKELELLSSITALGDGNWLPVSHVFDVETDLAELSRSGIEYLVTHDGDQASAVLDHTNSVSLLYIRSTKNPLKAYKIEDVEMARNPGKPLEIGYDEGYWKRKLNSYSNWRESWWREVIQNSSDACKTVYDRTGTRGRIECEKLYVEGSDKVIVQVSDNGVGMSRNTLIKAFLSPGGSMKRGVLGSVGGLGMAKELLIYAWPKWTIHTRHMDESAAQSTYVKGKHSPAAYQIWSREGKEAIPPEYKGRWIGSASKSGHGTQVSVVMRRNFCVEYEDLVRLLGFSHLPHATVYYREGTISKSGETIDRGSWTAVSASNKIPASAEPVASLTRSRGVGRGSVWARIYHMPRARTHTEVAVRINGLFMFTAMGRYENIPGKVIIELEYLPKGVRWDQVDERWEPLEDSIEQEETDYGPLEMLQESRTDLQYNYKYQLEAWLDKLKKEPKQVLKKRRPPTIVRAQNKETVTKPWDEILEQVESKKLLEGDQSSIDRVREKDAERLLGRIQQIIEEAERENIPPARAIRDRISDNEISRLQKMADAPLEWKQAVEDLEVAIDTSADWDFWNSEILPTVLKEAAKEGRGEDFTTNMVKFLHWEPDFILFDETASEEEYKLQGQAEEDSPNRDQYGRLISKAPNTWRPDSFGSKERRFAKFWVEVLRLSFILVGRGGHLLDTSGLGLQAGFHFENPPREDDLAATEYLGHFTVDPEKALRAIFIAPGEYVAEPKSSRWRHRYQLALAAQKDLSDIVAVAFHEIAHSLHPGGGHDTQFASILTLMGVNLAFQYSTLYNKILKHAIDTHRIRGVRGQAKAEEISKPVKGMGYYQVKCSGRKGRPPKFLKARDAIDFIADYKQENPESNCEVTQHYWDDVTDKKSGAMSWLEHYFHTPRDRERDADYIRTTARERWEDRGYESDYGKKAEDVFKRRRLRRRNPSKFRLTRAMELQVEEWLSQKPRGFGKNVWIKAEEGELYARYHAAMRRLDLATFHIEEGWQKQGIASELIRSACQFNIPIVRVENILVPEWAEKVAAMDIPGRRVEVDQLWPGATTVDFVQVGTDTCPIYDVSEL